MQFVIRIDRFEDDPIFKSFSKKVEADQYFLAVSQRVWEEAAPSAAYFRVEGTVNAREAVTFVKGGDRSKAVLLEKVPMPLAKLDLTGIDI